MILYVFYTGPVSFYDYWLLSFLCVFLSSVLEILTTLLCGYLSFVSAEVFHFSGILRYPVPSSRLYISLPECFTFVTVVVGQLTFFSVEIFGFALTFFFFDGDVMAVRHVEPN